MTALAVVLGGVGLGGCTNDTGSDCPALTADLLNANPVYTADGEPVVIVRLDLEGSCAGSGPETFVIYRPDGLEVTMAPTAIDQERLPESEPGSSVYLYRTQMLSVNVGRVSGAEITLTFMDESGFPPAVSCTNRDGLLSCEAI